MFVRARQTGCPDARNDREIVPCNQDNEASCPVGRHGDPVIFLWTLLSEFMSHRREFMISWGNAIRNNHFFRDQCLKLSLKALSCVPKSLQISQGRIQDFGKGESG